MLSAVIWQGWPFNKSGRSDVKNGKTWRRIGADDTRDCTEKKKCFRKSPANSYFRGVYRARTRLPHASVCPAGRGGRSGRYERERERESEGKSTADVAAKPATFLPIFMNRSLGWFPHTRIVMHGVASSVALGTRTKDPDDANDRVELNSRSVSSRCKSNRRAATERSPSKSFLCLSLPPPLFVSSPFFFFSIASYSQRSRGQTKGFSIPAICHTSETSTRNSPKGLSHTAHKSLPPFTTHLMVNGTSSCILRV